MRGYPWLFKTKEGAVRIAYIRVALVQGGKPRSEGKRKAKKRVFP